MKQILIVVDIQNDFVNGALGTQEATAMIPNAVEKIRNFDGTIFVTYDTHTDDYMNTAEGKQLPCSALHQGNRGLEALRSDCRCTQRKTLYRSRKDHVRIGSPSCTDPGRCRRCTVLHRTDRTLHGYLRGIECTAAQGAFPGS